MKVYQLPAREPDREKAGRRTTCTVVGESLFQRRFLDILDMRLTRVEDHAHALSHGESPHFRIAAIQEELQSIAATAVSAGWLTLALLARDLDRTIQGLWREPITTKRAQTVLPALHKLLQEGTRADRPI